jgi:opacity protein-like surface antigen
MRIMTSAALTYVMIGGLAIAADMQVPRPAYIPAPPAPTWGGFYLGGNIGGAFGTADNNFSFASVSIPLKGVIGGGQIGYNWQTGPIVFGAEADFQGSSMKGSISTPCIAPSCSTTLTASYSQSLPWFGTVRGRLGYAQSGWLLYATGGYAYGEVDTNASATAGALSAQLSRSQINNGWTVGAGAELMLAPRWSAKLEYLYVDLGNANNSYVFPGVATLNDSTHVTINAVRAGVNFRLWPD